MKLLKTLLFTILFTVTFQAKAFLIANDCIESVTCNIDTYAFLTASPTVTRTFTTTKGIAVSYKEVTKDTAGSYDYKVFMIPMYFTDPRTNTAKLGFKEIVVFRVATTTTTSQPLNSWYVEDHQRLGTYLRSSAYDSASSDLHEWSEMLYVDNAASLLTYGSTGYGSYVNPTVFIYFNYNKPYSTATGAYKDNVDYQMTDNTAWGWACSGDNRLTSQCFHLRVLEKARQHLEVNSDGSRRWVIDSALKNFVAAANYSFTSYDNNAKFVFQFNTPADGYDVPLDRNADLLIWNQAY